MRLQNRSVFGSNSKKCGRFALLNTICFFSQCKSRKFHENRSTFFFFLFSFQDIHKLVQAGCMPGSDAWLRYRMGCLKKKKNSNTLPVTWLYYYQILMVVPNYSTYSLLNYSTYSLLSYFFQFQVCNHAVFLLNSKRDEQKSCIFYSFFCSKHTTPMVLSIVSSCNLYFAWTMCAYYIYL